MKKDKLKQILEVFLTLQVTKELPRQGFLYSGFKRNDADSVAAHSFNVVSFSYLLARELKAGGMEIDPDKVLKISLLHDMGEAITGDVGTWVKVLAKGEFQKVENKAFGLLVRNLSHKEELISLFDEYTNLITVESQIVKLADTLDALVQGLNTPGARLDDFRKSLDKMSKQKIKDKALLELFDNAVNLLSKKQVTYFRGHIQGEQNGM
ncbi:HD domain-containing protein [Candidatus Woesearchaeota archaeon]|nr:HD domain-containing protein [Candidatus Woesearchaeota archaeon]